MKAYTDNKENKMNLTNMLIIKSFNKDYSDKFQKIMEMYGYYAKAICKNFGADYVWFLNWADNKCLHVKDWNGKHNGVDYLILGTEEMYKFLQSETAREECWL